MPEYSIEIKEKLTTLRGLKPAERHYCEVTAISYGAPDNLKVYSIAPYDEMAGYEGLSASLLSELSYADSLIVSLIPEKNTPLAELPRAASISEDGTDFVFNDFDDEISRLVMTHGEGVRVEVFGYWSATPFGGEPFDLLLSLWRGLTKAPKDMTRASVKLPTSTGFRSPNMNLPRRPHATSCPFIFGALLSSQDEIDYHKGCPYNLHLGGSIGVVDPDTGEPYTDCPRAKVLDCTDRLVTKNYWPGFDVRPDPIPNYVRGRNQAASAVGNASNLTDSIRAVIGTRYVKGLALLAYRNETNSAHPDKGFGAGLFEVCEGPVVSLWDFYMNGVYVGMEHQNLRLGTLGQPPTYFSPNVNSFSATAHAFGRIQGSFNENQAAQLTASIKCQGLSNIRVYSDSEAFTEQYTTNRAWAILEALTNARWGYGNDYSRYDIQSVIECADWCDETVAMHDPNGNLFTGTRSTCNVELTNRSVQQQINDLCVAGRIGLPFEFNGKEVFVPLKKEDLSDPASIPTFTDEGDDRNIIYDKEKSSLSWSQISDSELANQWTVNFDDYSNGGVETQLIFGEQRQQLRAGRAYGDRSIRVINKSQPAFGINNFSEAARFGVLLLYLGPLDGGGIANNFEVKFTTWYSDAFEVRNYKIIRVLNAKLQSRILLYFQSLGFTHFADVAYEYFRVKKVVRKGDLKVEITAQVYPADFYEAIEDVEQLPPIEVGPGEPNPGGRRDEIPEPITIIGLEQIGDRLRGRFAPSVY
jgi:hypothetical protein